MAAAAGPSQVEPGLWIGGAADLDCIAPLGITHVLSVCNGGPVEPAGGAAAAAAPPRRLHLEVEDADEEDLLSRLPEALDFIAAALAAPGGGDNSSGAVLVHCQAGVSRSAAVVAAHLMRARGEGAAAALARLRAAHPRAAPNAGFVRQLELWGEMGCGLDAAHPRLRRLQMQAAGRRFLATGELGAAAAVDEPSAASSAATLYRCRKCRGLVATSAHAVEADAGAPPGGVDAFGWRKAGKQRSPDAGGGEGGSLFVEPLEWMRPAIVGGDPAGKLYCPRPRCGARLGAYSWHGAQAAGGGWVTPAFQLHLGRLDAEPPRAALGVRRPVLSGGAPPPPPPPQQQQQRRQGRRFDFLILDCDGVMVDSERASCEALRRALLEVTGADIPHDFPADFRAVFGMDVRSCVEHYRAIALGGGGGGDGGGGGGGGEEAAAAATAAASDGAARAGGWGGGSAAEVAALAARVAAAKERHYAALTAAGVAAFPGVAALVAAARRLGLGVAVASSGSPEKIAHNLASSGLAGLVEPRLVVSAAYVARGKPAPDVYLEALRRLGCADGARALVVEDAVNGAAAARAAGCAVLAVATSLPADALAAHAEWVVERPGDIDLDALCAGEGEGGPAAALGCDL